MQRRRGIGEKEINVLKMLVENGRVTYTEIAKKLGMSPAGVMKKVKKLEDAGIVKGYTALIDHSKLGKPYKYMVFLKGEAGKTASIARKLKEVLGSSVLEIHRITGIYDIIIKLIAKEGDELTELLAKIQSVPGVKETNTSLILETIEERASVVPEDLKLPIPIK